MNIMGDSTTVSEPVIEELVTALEEKRAKKADSKTKPKRQPPYSVIVHNDDRHTWPYVIDVLQKVFGHSTELAYQLTSQVHFQGQAHVWSGTLELAELKRDQIRGFGKDFYAEKTVTFPLGVTIEPLPGD